MKKRTPPQKRGARIEVVFEKLTLSVQIFGKPIITISFKLTCLLQIHKESWALRPVKEKCGGRLSGLDPNLCVVLAGSLGHTYPVKGEGER